MRWSLGNSGDQEAKVVESRRRADALIAATKIGDDLPVLLARMLHIPAPLPVEQTQAVLKRQNADGGWGQVEKAKSDAYATGQALVALHRSGQLAAGDAAFQRGIAFLLRTQCADGSWLVRSRAFPVQVYKDSGFPHGKDQWISAAGSSWAVMALAVALPEQPAASNPTWLQTN